jgi:hypothetical protein
MDFCEMIHSLFNLLNLVVGRTPLLVPIVSISALCLRGLARWVSEGVLFFTNGAPVGGRHVAAGTRCVGAESEPLEIPALTAMVCDARWH